jgi:hypothetical protein
MALTILRCIPASRFFIPVCMALHRRSRPARFPAGKKTGNDILTGKSGKKRNPPGNDCLGPEAEPEITVLRRKSNRRLLFCALPSFSLVTHAQQASKICQIAVRQATLTAIYPEMTPEMTKYDPATPEI